MWYTVPIFGLTPLLPLHPMFDCFFYQKSLWIVWRVDDWCYREINCLRTNSGFPLPGTTSRACQTSTKLSTTTTTIVLAANTSAVFLRTCYDHYQKPKKAVFSTQPNWCNDLRSRNYAKIAHFKTQFQKLQFWKWSFFRHEMVVGNTEIRELLIVDCQNVKFDWVIAAR